MPYIMVNVKRKSDTITPGKVAIDVYFLKFRVMGSGNLSRLSNLPLRSIRSQRLGFLFDGIDKFYYVLAINLITTTITGLKGTLSP